MPRLCLPGLDLEPERKFFLKREDGEVSSDWGELASSGILIPRQRENLEFGILNQLFNHPASQSLAGAHHVLPKVGFAPALTESVR